MSAASDPPVRAASAEADAAIRRLAAAYAVAVVTHDSDLWLSLWASSGEASGDPLRLDLHWARNVARRWQSLGTTVLHITTHLIEPLTEDRARGTVFCLAELDRPQGVFVRQSLVYADDYVLANGEWRFATRRHLLWYGRDAVNPRASGPADWPSAQVGRGLEIGEELRAGRGTTGDGNG